MVECRIPTFPAVCLSEAHCGLEGSSFILMLCPDLKGDNVLSALLQSEKIHCYSCRWHC